MTVQTSPVSQPTATVAWKPRFFTIWTGQAFSLFGSQLVQFALIWYLTERTASATTLAIASLMGLLPQIFLFPLIGTLVDRWDRRRILIGADGLVALATMGLAVLFAFNLVQVWHIYALMFIRAVGGGFHQSAMGASVVLLVPREQLARVQGLNQALNGGLNIVSAPLGALLLAWLPIQGILAIDVVTALIAIIPLLFIAIPQPERTANGARPSVWGDMRDGLRYVVTWPGLMIILAMAALINLLLTPTASLTPILITRHFEGGALELGWLSGANGIGIVLGGVILGAWGGFKRRMVTALLGLIVMGTAIVIIGLAPANALWLAILATLILGLASPVVNGSIGAVLQASIAPEMQGRVFAVVFSFAMATAPLGLLVAGPLADALGARVWYWIGGVVCALMGIVGFLIPAVFNFEKNKTESS